MTGEVTFLPFRPIDASEWITLLFIGDNQEYMIYWGLDAALATEPSFQIKQSEAELIKGGGSPDEA